MKTINSYDMFDTLFARFDESPKSIFIFIQEKYREFNPSYDFVNSRINAEKKCYDSKFFKLEDVYEIMVDDFNLPPEHKDQLINMEYNVERMNLIPVKENLDKLKPNDLVISDMYLPQKFLKEFLPKYVNIIVTPSGKAEGYVYEELKKKYNIISHTGDNPHSDVTMAEEYGIDANFYPGTERTDNEQFLYDNNLRIISNICRKVRLANHYNDDLSNELSFLQTNINIPMLFIMSAEIVSTMIDKNISNCLISGRDGEKLQKVISILDSNRRYEYFYTSRMSRKKSSEDYLKYTKAEMCNRDTLIVDLDGTGWTLRNLKMKMENYDKETADKMHLYLFHYLDEANLPGFMERPYTVPEYDIDSMFFTNKFNHNRLELLNLTNHPMVEDVSEVLGNFLIDFYDNGPDEETSNLIKVMDNTFDSFMQDVMFSYDMVIQELEALDKTQRKMIVSYLYKSLTDYKQDPFDSLERQQREEEKTIEKKLKEI